MQLRDVYDHPAVEGAFIGAMPRMTVERAQDAGEEPILSFRGNTSDEDRYGTIVEPGGAVIEPYMASGAGTFLFAHDYGSLPVGKTIELKKKAKSLDFKIRYAVEIHEQARIVYQLSLHGYLPATSIGFIPLKWEEYEAKTLGDMWAENRRFVSWELLELSAVPVPANRYALMNALKARHVTENELRAIGLDQTMRRSAPYVVGSFQFHRGAPPAHLNDAQKELQESLQTTLQRVIADAVARGGEVKVPDETPAPEPEETEIQPVEDPGTDYNPEDLNDENTPVDDPDEADRSLVEYIASAQAVLMHVTGERLINKEQLAAHVRIVRAYEKRNPDKETLVGSLRAGAVLNKSNKERIRSIKQLAQEVLDAAGDNDDNADDEEKAAGGDDERSMDVASLIRGIVGSEETPEESSDGPDDSTTNEETEGDDSAETDSTEPSPSAKSAIDLILS